MKAESTIMPTAPYEIEFDGDTAVIRLFENIEQEPSTEDDETPKWKWDEYTMNVRARDSLVASIDANPSAWIEAAKNAEYANLSSEIRAKRDALLSKTDFTMCSDAPISDTEKEKYRVYRQALRDIPEQSGFPFDVIFPVLKK